MHIRAFVVASILALGSLACMPSAFAIEDAAPDICVLDYAQPDHLAPAIETAELSCSVIDVAEFSFASTGTERSDADWPLCPIEDVVPLDASAYRQHVDPGRCVV